MADCRSWHQRFIQLMCDTQLCIARIAASHPASSCITVRPRDRNTTQHIWNLLRRHKQRLAVWPSPFLGAPSCVFSTPEGVRAPPAAQRRAHSEAGLTRMARPARRVLFHDGPAGSMDDMDDMDGPDPLGLFSALSVLHRKWVCMALLYGCAGCAGCAGRLTAINGGLRPGQRWRLGSAGSALPACPPSSARRASGGSAGR